MEGIGDACITREVVHGEGDTNTTDEYQGPATKAIDKEEEGRGGNDAFDDTVNSGRQELGGLDRWLTSG